MRCIKNVNVDRIHDNSYNNYRSMFNTKYSEFMIPLTEARKIHFAIYRRKCLSTDETPCTTHFKACKQPCWADC